MRPAVTYTPCDTSSREQTGNIITFTQFEEGNILTKSYNDAESDDDDLIMPPVLSEEDMDTMDSSNDSDYDLIFTEMLEESCSSPRWDNLPSGHQRNPLLGIFGKVHVLGSKILF